MGGGRPGASDGHGGDPHCNACEKLRAGLLQALADREFALLTEDDVAAEAGMPLSGFRRHYAGLDALLEATYREVEGELHPLFTAALEGEGHWTDCLCEAIEASYDRLERIPGAIRLYEAAWAGPPSLQRRRDADRRRYIEQLVERAPELPELHAEFVIGALYRAAQDGMASPGADVAQLRGRARELIAVLEPVPA
jgi:AcrR family transcriptional regulator